MTYVIKPEEIPNQLEKCISFTRGCQPNLKIIDIRVFYQKWTDNLVGHEDTFHNIKVYPGEFLSPTFVLKLSRSLRYVFFAGEFAYALVGTPTLQYYDCIRNRQLPKIEDLPNSFLTYNETEDGFYHPEKEK